ncbi:glycoside hydrolase family 113 [Reichenbachiella sp.]|uniref:glycoside hydrolase family 113 n=1 Tax=Reichenbachiella sp. TaxID=2184521 RepID=UPI003BAFC375
MNVRLILLSCIFSCGAVKQDINDKINGLCLVAPSFELKPAYYQPIQNTGANWVAIIPYAFCSPTQPQVTFDHPKQWIGETTDGIKQAIQLAHKSGLKVMLKPHLWVIGQGWAGDLEYTSEEQLNQWKSSYATYILNFAQVAHELNVEMISIGTEIRQIAKTNDFYWIDLINRVRKIYSGPLTYSANWDNYENIPFWRELDYIGIDAYFPISESKTPSVEELIKNGSETKQEIRDFTNVYLKKVLFTEFGFKSQDYSTSGHWKQDHKNKTVNIDGQANAYKALFKLYWNEDWFLGGFAWKWHYKHKEAGGTSNQDFTPQNKLAEKILRNQYSKNKDQ